MKELTLSRGTQIDTDKCVQNAGSRYDLVLIASVRAKEIRRQLRLAEETTPFNPVVTAILEVQDGKIDRDYLKRVR